MELRTGSGERSTRSAVKPAGRPQVFLSKGPIVVLGGFLAPARIYTAMANELRQQTGRPVSIVPTTGIDWLPSFVQAGWAIILRKLDRAVRNALGQDGHERATLVCHSAGGLLARLYVGNEGAAGHLTDGRRLVDCIITLGTPHYNECRRVHGGMLACFANVHVPGAYALPDVAYVSVAGRHLRGNCRGSLRERHACNFYRRLGGDGDGWGDGLVPLESALLEGSHQIVLDGVSHHTSYGRTWFGSAHVVAQWWDGAANAESPQDPMVSDEVDAGGRR